MLSAKSSPPTLLYLGEKHLIVMTEKGKTVITDTQLNTDARERVDTLIESQEGPIAVAIASSLVPFLSLPVLFTLKTFRQPMDAWYKSILKSAYPYWQPQNFLYRPIINGWHRHIQALGYPVGIYEQLNQSPWKNRISCCLPAWAFTTVKKTPAVYVYATVEDNMITWIAKDNHTIQRFFQDHCDNSAEYLKHSHDRFCIFAPEYAKCPVIWTQYYFPHTKENIFPSKHLPITNHVSLLTTKNVSLMHKHDSADTRRWTKMGILGILSLVALVTLLFQSSQLFSSLEPVTTAQEKQHNSPLITHFEQEKGALNLPVRELLTAIRPSDTHVMILEVSWRVAQKMLIIQAKADSSTDMFHYVQSLHHPDFGNIELISHQAETQSAGLLFSVHITIATPD